MTKDVTSQLAITLKQCQTDLNTLFDEQSVTSAFRHNLKKLHNYYVRHFWETNKLNEKKETVHEYQFLIETIKEIKTGNLNAENALKNVQQLSSNRKMDVLKDNIFKTCELLFWLTAALTSYAFCIGFGIPILFFNPILGAALTIGASVLMLESAIQAVKCIDEFQSFNAINKQEKLERQALSFFIKPQPSTEEIAEPDDNLDIDIQTNGASCYC